ncbi:MAG TPA: hypothetical protein VEJ38_10725 [Candidatus Acidoferrales bacterium]|nr:hypothetical protein [Candidatus Acidoferrales bacterium]
MSDWLRAGLAAAVLLGLAALLVLVAHPGGPSVQLGWYAGLLPCSIVAALFGSLVEGLFSHGQRIAYLGLTPVFSFLCYFIFAFIMVKVVRAAGWAKKD